MKSVDRVSRMRVFWIATVLTILTLSAGGYYWYEQVAVKYDKITNAKRV